MPHRHNYIPIFAFSLATCLTTCRQAYAPPAITNPNHYLVVDGFINASPNSVTTFNLNRTRNLGDSTVQGIPELNATIAIVGSGGATWPLTETAGTSIYASAPLTLDATQQYSISIATTNGEKYASSPVPCKVTPPIDSIFWRQPFDLTIYASTHDPTNNTRYYRYDYNETWEHDAELMTVWGVANGMMYAQDSTNQTQRCWTTDTSTNILLASSAAQSTDVIDSFPLVTIPNSDARVTKVYSILVRQYALTEDAYNYWQLIRQTTQDVGTLFDVQPTQLIGNITCTSNPSEPVIGFITATTVQQQRILIAESSLNDWEHNQPGFGCDTVSIPFNFANPFAYNYPNPNFAPYYFDGSALVLASSICLNCLLLGGTNIRPPFMPD
jgi:hypothetical protein